MDFAYVLKPAVFALFSLVGDHTFKLLVACFPDPRRRPLNGAIKFGHHVGRLFLTRDLFWDVSGKRRIGSTDIAHSESCFL